jgi:hypothetical protein
MMDSNVCRGIYGRIASEKSFRSTCSGDFTHSSKEEFIEKHFPFALPTSERASGDISDESFFPDITAGCVLLEQHPF